MNDAEARALMRRRIAQMNAGDVDGVLEGMHPDIRWHAPPDSTSPRVYVGHEGVREFFGEWLEAWGKFEQEVGEVRVQGEWAIATMTFRTRGEASGVEVEEQGAYLMRIRDGKLAELRIFRDYDEAVAAWTEIAGN